MLEIGKTYRVKDGIEFLVPEGRYKLIDWFSAVDEYLFEDQDGDLLPLDATVAEEVFTEAEA